MTSAYIGQARGAAPSRRSGWSARVIGVAALAGMLSACSSSGSDGQLLLPAVPGYVMDTHASGDLDRTGAADTSPLSRSDAGRALSRDGFRRGEVRVFVRRGTLGPAFFTSAVLRFKNARGASRFAAAIKSGLNASGRVAFFTPPDISSGTGYLLTAPTKVGGRLVFCAGVFFPHAARVHLVLACDDMPLASTAVLQVAGEQYRRAEA